jgi:hypothetical protein
MHTIMKTHSHLHKKNHIVAFFSIVGVGLFLVFLFMVTRGTDPHTSELLFTEYSTKGKNVGSVIPASCESNFQHIANECAPTINLQFQ